MKHGSLFSGIGGFDLAAEWMGWENVFHCEWNEFGQKVLKHYWPNAECFSDITKSDFKKYYGTIDIISGGFPCQPYSAAGKRLGKEDERHLWPEMLRAIREIAPRYVVGENVRGLTNWNGGLVFSEVCSNLENLGYSVATYLIPAGGVNAPHRRERIWFIAHSPGKGTGHISSTDKGGKIRRTSGYGSDGNVAHTRIERLERSPETREFTCVQQEPHQQFSRFLRTKWEEFPTQPPVCGGNDGLPTKLDGISFPKWRNESIKAYGNAVCPQVVFEIFKAIEAHENL